MDLIVPKVFKSNNAKKLYEMYKVGSNKLKSDMNIFRLANDIRNIKFIVKKKIVQKFPNSFKEDWKKLIMSNPKIILTIIEEKEPKVDVIEEVAIPTPIVAEVVDLDPQLDQELQ